MSKKPIDTLVLDEMSAEELAYWKKKEPWNYMEDSAHEDKRKPVEDKKD